MPSPFDWKGKPSIVRNDVSFRADRNGRSISQKATMVVEQIYAKGINHGTIVGVTDKVEAGLSESFQRIHRRKK